MEPKQVSKLLELPVEERIRLVGLLWDSIAAIPDQITISPAIRAELEERLAEFDRNSDEGFSWDEVKSRLRDGSWRTG